MAEEAWTKQAGAGWKEHVTVSRGVGKTTKGMTGSLAAVQTRLKDGYSGL